MTLDELFDTYNNIAFRLEALPVYTIPSESEAVQQFLKSGTLPRDYNRDWVDFVREETTAGKSMRRLRLVHDPMTDYERFELDGPYKANVKAGEEIRIMRIESPVDTQDFWAFDDRWIAFMNYSESGEFLGSTVADLDPQVVRRTLEKWQDVFSSAPRLDEFR